MKRTLLMLALSLMPLFLVPAAHAASEVQTKIALNWKAEPEFGGFYEGREKGIFKKYGLNVEIQEGGSATPTPQMLMAAQVDYAVVSAEDILLNNDRDPQRKLVAVFAVFEKSPYIIMTHKSEGYKSLKDFFQNSDGTLSVQKGLPYVEYLTRKFAPVKATVVPYTGGVGVFEKTKKFAQQGFYTSEFLIAESQKLDPQAWLVADEGFNPYIAVLAVREDFLNKNKPQVKAMVSASREAWQSYLKSPEDTNKLMNRLNPAMTAPMMTLSLQKMKDFMHFEPRQLGQMKTERWQQLGQQMTEMKLISKPVEAHKIFQDF